MWKGKGIEENGWKVRIRNKQLHAEFVRPFRVVMSKKKKTNLIRLIITSINIFVLKAIELVQCENSCRFISKQLQHGRHSVAFRQQTCLIFQKTRLQEILNFRTPRLCFHYRLYGELYLLSLFINVYYLSFLLFLFISTLFLFFMYSKYLLVILKCYDRPSVKLSTSTDCMELNSRIQKQPTSDNVHSKFCKYRPAELTFNPYPANVKNMVIS